MPVGHPSPFSGDITIAIHCGQEVFNLIRSGDYTSKTLYAHLFEGLGELNALRPDSPTPVFGSGLDDVSHLNLDECEAKFNELTAPQGPGVAAAFDYGLLLQVILQVLELLKKK